MSIIDFLKKKGKSKESTLSKKEIEIPPAPPTKEELPSLPSAEDIPSVEKEIVEKEMPSALEKAEKEAVKAQKEELEEREELKLQKPIFVYLDAYKEIMNESNSIYSILKESSDSLARVSEFREDEDKEFKKWDNQIKDIQKKLTYVDKTLFSSKK